MLRLLLCARFCKCVEKTLKMREALLCVTAEAECHDGECAGDVHARFAACHRDGDFHGRFGHDFWSDAEFFIAEDDEPFLGPFYVVDARDVFACFEGDDFVAVFLVPLDAIEGAVPALDGNPFLAAAGGAFDGHVVGAAAVAAQVDSFEPEAVGAADDGTYVECAAEVVHENGKLYGLFVRDCAVARFLFQVHVSFKAKPCTGAERFVQVNHLRLVLTCQSLGFGQVEPFGVGLELTAGAWYVIA